MVPKHDNVRVSSYRVHHTRVKCSWNQQRFFSINNDLIYRRKKYTNFKPRFMTKKILDFVNVFIKMVLIDCA